MRDPLGDEFSQVSAAPYRYGYYDHVNGDLCGEQGWYGEETLDVEAVHAVAPDADVTYVGAASCMDNDLLDALGKIVDNHLADIVSNSWGEIMHGPAGYFDTTIIAPYEQTLKAHFASFEALADNNKFRISRAVR